MQTVLTSERIAQGIKYSIAHKTYYTLLNTWYPGCGISQKAVIEAGEALKREESVLAEMDRQDR